MYNNRFFDFGAFMIRLRIFFIVCIFHAARLCGASNEFSLLSWKFDMPASLEDYNVVYENRAKAGLKEINMFSDADIVCVQGLALSTQELQNLLGCYNLISYANGCAVLVKKYAKHFIPLYKTAFLHGTSVLLQAQDATDIKLNVCSVDCHEKNHHEGCIILREEKPTLYVGTGVYTHPVFSKMKLLGTVKSTEGLQGVAFDIEENKQNLSDFVIKMGLNKDGKMPDKSTASSEPLYIAVLWKGFHRVAPENQTYTAFSTNHRIALKSEPVHMQHSKQEHKEPLRLPHGIDIDDTVKQISSMQKEFLMGKPVELYYPVRLRRLYQNEFTVLFWNMGNPQASQADKELALQELMRFGADVVGLQGLQGLNIDCLLMSYSLVQSNQDGAILIHKRSSLMHKDPHIIQPLKGLGCTIYDVSHPDDEIIVYCLDLQNDATLYTHNLKVRPYNTIVMGTNLHANKISFSDALKDHSLYHAVGEKNNQIVVTAFPHKIRLLAGSVFWNDASIQVYSGIGMLTKYGTKSETTTLSQPLFATFEWDGIIRYKMDIPLQKMPKNKAKSN